MAAYLREMGYPDAAEDTAQIVKLMDDIETRAEALRGLWRTAEWIFSGDYGEDQLEQGVKEWREARERVGSEARP